MTIERPMFPPRADAAVNCEIIQFSAASRPARTVSEKPSPAEVTAICERINRTLTPRELRRAGKPPLPPPLTETCKNARIRIKRRDAWWHAGWVASYWRARLDWQGALECAQTHGIADSASFPPPRANESRFDLVDKWREALARQMLTPAPDLSAVTWKRAKLKTDEFNRLPITAVRAEQVIADDVAFLAAHPVRQSNRRSAAERNVPNG
jgi:hypothetical protein